MSVSSLGLLSLKSDESKSLKKSKRQKKSEKVKQVGFDFLSDFWQKKYLINGDVLNAESERSAQSHNNCFQTNYYNFKMLITPEQKVPQRSDAFQNDHKSRATHSLKHLLCKRRIQATEGALSVCL